MHWSVVSHLRLEGVSVDIGGSADNLVADVLVANNSVSSLDSLQDGGRVGDGLDAWRLWDESLAVHSGEGWH